MVKPDSKSYYAAAIIIGLAVGVATRDMPVGILTAIVLALTFAGMKKRDNE
jgi:hypothetical protein